MSVKECGRCTETNKNSQRCKRRICKTFPCCWQHLKSVYGLHVKESQIPGGGMGLYTTKDIIRRGPVKDRRRDVKIVKYTGELLTQAAFDGRYDNDEATPYVFTVNGRYIDARSTQSNVARYANGCDKPRHRLRCNARISNGAWLVATRTIRAGSEILTEYGPHYWAF